MTALYNEIDPFAAAWLRELIAGGHIAPGIVIEDSIEDLTPNDLKPFHQVHFFAGIGVWSYALRRVGWPDDRRIWTGSCPCQPFSAAGKGGGFADERHLWPAFFHLITQCRPDVVVGEQVASKDGLAWLDLVQADMEGAGHAFGVVDLCAAGVGAPHIRQRLWWVGKRLADADQQGSGRRGIQGPRQGDGAGTRSACERPSGLCATGHMEHAPSDGWEQWGSEPSGRGAASGCGVGGVDDDDDDTGLEGQRGGYQAEGGRVGTVRPVAEAGEFGGVAHNLLQQRPDGEPGKRAGDDEGGRVEGSTEVTGLCGDLRPGPVSGHWGNADWLHCRDGKWRAVEPGTFPLVNGAPVRVGRLRGYGNAIVAQAAEEFLRAALT